MYKKTTTTVEEFFDSAMPRAEIECPVVPPVEPIVPPVQQMYMRMPVTPPKSTRPIIRVDVPLMIRLLEYAKEEATGDIILHEMVERMVDLCEYGEVLDMEEYYDIVEEKYSHKSDSTNESGEIE